MARESGLIYRTNGRWWMDAGEPGDELKAFEALVRADEREACAQIADGQLRNTNALLTYPPQSSAAYQIGVAIRARSGEKK
jgi:hypothetical protein